MFNFNYKGQVSVESLIALAVAMIFLLLLSTVLFDQYFIYYGQQQQIQGYQVARNLANEINDVYFLGEGSVKTVLLVLPETVDLANSSIGNKSIVLNVNGVDVIVSTKALVVGEFPSEAGSYVFTITSFGSFVAVSTNLLSFKPIIISETLSQGQSKIVDINIQNLAPVQKNYLFVVNFSHSDANLTSTDEGTISFNASDSNQISVELSCLADSSGAYAGELIFSSDVNSSLPVRLVCLSSQSKLSIYPAQKDFSVQENSSSAQSLLICNSSNFNYSSIKTTISGAIAAYATTSFSGDINANSCRTLTLNVNSPAVSADTNIYLGTLTINTSGFSATADLNLLVTSAVFPTVTLYLPEDNNLVSSPDSNINFIFSVDKIVSSCGLYIDDVLQDTNNDTVQADVNIMVDANVARLGEGDHLWGVTCIDSVGNIGTSIDRNINYTHKSSFLNAIGGTISYSGNYKIHTFTSSETFTVTELGSGLVDVLIVGGGGGGARGGGAGGAGGFSERLNVSITLGAKTVTVGGGGSAGTGSGNWAVAGGVGENSVFNGYTVKGGGYGGSAGGGSGGSGGGATNSSPGTDNDPNSDGYSGGSYNATSGCDGGGGGAGSIGGTATSTRGGAGGAGKTSTITGTTLAGGGGGGGSGTGHYGGSGVNGGGNGGGSYSATIYGIAGTANTGGGGGGGGVSGTSWGNGGNGGSGIVVIRYQYQ